MSILSRSMSGEVKQHMHTFCVNKEILSAMTEKEGSQKRQPREKLCWLQPLTQDLPEEGWSGAGRLVDAEVVDWRPRERHADPHQRVGGVAVERNHHQEDAADAVDDREKQRQLQEREELCLKPLLVFF